MNLECIRLFSTDLVGVADLFGCEGVQAFSSKAAPVTCVTCHKIKKDHGPSVFRTGFLLRHFWPRKTEENEEKHQFQIVAKSFFPLLLCWFLSAPRMRAPPLQLLRSGA